MTPLPLPACVLAAVAVQAVASGHEGGGGCSRNEPRIDGRLRGVGGEFDKVGAESFRQKHAELIWLTISRRLVNSWLAIAAD